MQFLDYLLWYITIFRLVWCNRQNNLHHISRYLLICCMKVTMFNNKIMKIIDLNPGTQKIFPKIEHYSGNITMVNAKRFISVRCSIILPKVQHRLHLASLRRFHDFAHRLAPRFTLPRLWTRLVFNTQGVFGARTLKKVVSNARSWRKTFLRLDNKKYKKPLCRILFYDLSFF